MEVHSLNVLINQNAGLLSERNTPLFYRSFATLAPMRERNYYNITNERQSDPLIEAGNQICMHVQVQTSFLLPLAGFVSGYVFFCQSFVSVTIIVTQNCEPFHLLTAYLYYQKISYAVRLHHKHKKCKGIAVGGNL